MDLEKLMFYNSHLKYAEVYQEMKNHMKKNGVYLMRSTSPPEVLTLSVIDNMEIVHITISRRESDFTLGGKSFKDLRSLVLHFKDHPIRSETGYTNIFLKTPLCRLHGPSEWKDSSLECCLEETAITQRHAALSKLLSNSHSYDFLKELEITTDTSKSYANQNCGPGKIKYDSVSSNEGKKTEGKNTVSLPNGWTVEPFLFFKSPEGELCESLPTEIWTSMGVEQMKKLQTLKNNFEFFENYQHGRKMAGRGGRIGQ